MGALFWQTDFGSIGCYVPISVIALEPTFSSPNTHTEKIQVMDSWIRVSTLKHLTSHTFKEAKTCTLGMNIAARKTRSQVSSCTQMQLGVCLCVFCPHRSIHNNFPVCVISHVPSKYNTFITCILSYDWL